MYATKNRFKTVEWNWTLHFITGLKLIFGASIESKKKPNISAKIKSTVPKWDNDIHDG